MEVGETERSVIHDILKKASKFYQDGKLPTVGDLDDLEDELYDSLFGFRDETGVTPINRPVKFPLVDILKALKFGRRAESQKQLDEFIRQLENKNTNQ